MDGAWEPQAAPHEKLWLSSDAIRAPGLRGPWVGSAKGRSLERVGYEKGGLGS